MLCALERLLEGCLHTRPKRAPPRAALLIEGFPRPHHPIVEFAKLLFLLREHLICREDERHGGRSKARTGSLILMALGQGGGRPVAEERARLNDSDEASDDVV